MWLIASPAGRWDAVTNHRGSTVRRAALLVAGVGGLVASALVARDAAPQPAVVCTSQAVLGPVQRIEPFGEVHLVDDGEAAALATGCAHAGRYELTPTCVLWRTEPVPVPVTVVGPEQCPAPR